MQFSLFSFFFLFAVVTVTANDSNAVFEAVKNDDSAAIRSAIENDSSMKESIGPGGQTPLIRAILTGKLNAVNTLLDLGADASATEKDGYTVFHAAGFQGRAEILEVLLQYFADQKESGGFVLDPVTDKHKDGFYPMHVSIVHLSSLLDILIQSIYSTRVKRFPSFFILRVLYSSAYCTSNPSDF